MERTKEEREVERRESERDGEIREDRVCEEITYKTRRNINRKRDDTERERAREGEKGN